MRIAVLALAAMLATAAQAAPTPKPGGDWRELDPESVLVIDTTKGRVFVEMVPEAAPKHVERIKALARQGLYDGNTFFRVIDMFMAQTGDPKNTGEGGSELPNLEQEFVFRRDAAMPFVTVARPMGLQAGFIRSLPVLSQADSYMAMTGDRKAAAWGTYCPGVAGMARDDDPNSANSQFFIMRQAYPSLDKRYTVWGRAVLGLEAVRAIKTGEPVENPDKMLRVRVLADLPPAEQPRIQAIDPTGPAFAALVERTRRARGADFSVCDVELPARAVGPG
jgi:peptidylprolyl isomerase